MHLEAEAEAEVKGRLPVAGCDFFSRFCLNLFGALDGYTVD